MHTKMYLLSMSFSVVEGIEPYGVFSTAEKAEEHGKELVRTGDYSIYKVRPVLFYH